MLFNVALGVWVVADVWLMVRERRYWRGIAEEQRRQANNSARGLCRWCAAHLAEGETKP